MYPREYLSFGWRRPAVAALAVLSLTLGALPTLTGAAPGSAAAPAQAMTAGSCPSTPAGDTTASLDQLRTGWDNCESAMGPAAVKTFTQHWKTAVGGQVYAQPLVIGNTVFVVTENDWVYGLDRTSGAILWHTHLGNAFVIGKAPYAALRKCHDLVPNVGVTGTPAVDPATGDVAFFAKVMSGKLPQYYLYDMDPSNGTVVRKVLISGHPSNAPTLTFSGQMENERTGVLITGGAAYAGFSSHCDTGQYAGYVARVDLSTGHQSLWTDESGTVYNRAGIWESGGGLLADPNDPSAGVILASGNGVSPAPGPGSKPPGQLAESVISLKTNSSGAMAAQDFFSPAVAPQWDAADTDYSSGGVVGLPYGTSTYPHVVIEAGKSGQIFVLNEDSLGGREQAPKHKDAALFYTKAYGGQWAHPAIFETGTISSATNSTANNYLFYVGRQDSMRVFHIAAENGDKPILSDIGNSSLVYPYTSGSPVVTSNGNDAASAVVWVVRAQSATGTGGELDAYSLGSLITSSGAPNTHCSSKTPCTLTPIWHSPAPFIATKFAIPATSDGWVYVGTRAQNSNGGLTASGYVIGYAAPGTGAPVKPATTTVAPASLSSLSTAAPASASPVSITAKKTMRITGVTTSAGASNAPATRDAFSVTHVYLQKKGAAGQQPVNFPVALSPGDKLTAYVRFTPVAPGLNNGTLTFLSATRGFTVPVPLAGNGVQNGITAQETSAAFQLAPDQNDFTVPVGVPVQQTLDFTNFGNQPVQVTSVTPPTGEFTAKALPAVGDTINPGETVSVQVNFRPTQVGPASSSLTIAGSSGPPATVSLTGTAIPAVSRLTPSSRTVSFGTVPVGKQASGAIHITNTGNQTSVITTTTRLTRPFATVFAPPDLLPFNPPYDMTIPVTFTPTRKGTFTAHYTLHWTDYTGSHSLTVTLTGKAA